MTRSRQTKEYAYFVERLRKAREEAGLTQVQAKEKTEKLIAEFRFNDALAAIWQLIFLGDKYVDEKKPWTLKPESVEFKEIIGSLLFLISEIGGLIEPFLPETSEKISKQIKNRER